MSVLSVYNVANILILRIYVTRLAMAGFVYGFVVCSPFNALFALVCRITQPTKFWWFMIQILNGDRTSLSL